MSEDRIKAFTEFRQRMNQRILDEPNQVVRRFFALDTQTYQPGALDVKTKELCGLVASMVLRCDDCISYHVAQCRDAGVNRAEMFDAFSIGLVVGLVAGYFSRFDAFQMWVCARLTIRPTTRGWARSALIISIVRYPSPSAWYSSVASRRSRYRSLRLIAASSSVIASEFVRPRMASSRTSRSLSRVSGRSTQMARAIVRNRSAAVATVFSSGMGRSASQLGFRRTMVTAAASRDS